MSQCKTMHYCPANGTVGDTIPFYWNGEFHLFYMRRLPHRFTVHQTIEHIVSTDLVHWRELPTAVRPGGRDEKDYHLCGTGSVIERDGTFYYFYYARNDRADPHDNIGLATSSDLISWTKQPGSVVLRDEKWYAAPDWRDPFVFWNEQEKCYWMLLTCLEKDGPGYLKGCVGLAVSDDLAQWRVRPPLWAPGTYVVPECPEMFELSGKWFLLANWIHPGGTSYYTADAPGGPWKSPYPNTLDSHDAYAFRTVNDGARRVAFGWVTSHSDFLDSGSPTWGGHVAAPREFALSDTGGIDVRCAPEWLGQFGRELPLEIASKWGNWDIAPGRVAATSPTTSAYAVTGPICRDYLLECDLTVQAGTSAVGFLVQSEHDMSCFYRARIDLAAGRITADRMPPCWPETWLYEQPFRHDPKKPIKCVLSLADNILEIFLNDSVALTMRLYDYHDGALGMFVESGQASFDNIRLATTDDNQTEGL